MAANKFLKTGMGLTFILFVISVFYSGYSYSQDLSKEISVKFKKEPLENVINIISQSAQIQFSYSSQLIPLKKEITYKAKKKKISEILDQVLKTNGINYSIIENQVVLTPMGNSMAEDSKSGTKKLYTVSGFVKDKKTGEVLIGASIYPSGKSMGTATNAFGFYSLTLPEGNYNLNVSFVGYSTFSSPVSLNKNILLSVVLDYSTVEIETIEVVENDSISAINNNTLNAVKMTSKEFDRISGLSGNADIIKSLQSVPGINMFGDGSAFFYVRGGNTDQNLILIDDAPIYNPSHLFGFFTALVPNAIKEMNVYKGDFPANFGGRLSSVIDIRTKDGNINNMSFSGNLGPYVSDVTIEGPFKKEKHSFFISARKSNLDWLNLSRSESSTLKMLFFDINLKLNFKLSPNNRLFVTLYDGYDEFSRMVNSKTRNFGISWKNALGTIRWNHIFNSKLFSNTTLYFSKYDYYLYFSRNPDDYWNSSILNKTLKSDFTYYLNPQNTIKAGIELSSHYSNPGNISLSDPTLLQSVPKVSSYNSNELNFYLCNEQHIGSKFLIRYGIRLPYWQNAGPVNIYYFDVNHQVSDTLSIQDNSVYSRFLLPEPRLNINYLINQNSSLKACYNHSKQFEQVISNSTSPFNSLEVLIPCGPNILPQKSDYFSLGFTKTTPKKKIQFSSEAYYRKYNNQVDYEEHPNLLFNPLIEGELRFGEAWSYGAEFLIKKSEGHLTGWLSYTYSRVFKKTEEVNNNDAYPASYDRPHNINMNISWFTKKRWSFSANWQYLTGETITTPSGFYYYNGYSIPVYNEKNNDRLPDYHRLDISIGFRISKPGKKFQHNICFTLYNVYRRKNPISINFNKIIDEDGNYVVPSDLNGNYEKVPTAISVAGIIPSITYKFNFQ